MIQNNSIEFISLEMNSEEVFNIVNKLYDCFYLSAISVRDKLKPFKKFLVLSSRPRCFDDECIKAKHLKRKLERAWRKMRSTESEVRLQSHLCDYRELLKLRRDNCLSQKLSEKSSKLRFLTFHELFRRKIFKLTKNENPTTLAHRFCNFFREKVSTLLQNFDNTLLEIEATCKSSFSSFMSVSSSDLRLTLNKISNSTAPHDIIPTHVLKVIINCYVESFTDLISSISLTGVFRSSLKQGIIIPLNKKNDEDEIENYRPVTNIRTMSKIVEKCVLQQMVDYFDRNGLWPPLQSAYRHHHSTETAIVYCLERVTEILARRKLALLISLDLTSAFDTVNFNVLLKILQNKLGFEGSVLRFFESYLKNRNSRVTVENELSDYFYNEAGVPQGSILGPVLFSFYLTPLYEFLNATGVIYHFYADDSQFIFELDYNFTSISFILKQIIDVMCKLKLVNNSSKTDLIVFLQSQF